MTDPAESPEAKAASPIESRASVLQTVRMVLFAPDAFFSAFPGGRTGLALGLATLTHAIADPLAVLGLRWLLPVPAALALEALVAAPISTLFGVLLSAAAVYAMTRVLPGKRARFGDLVAIFAFAQLPFLAAVVPALGLLVAIGWSLWLSVLGLRRVLDRSVLFSVSGILAAPLALVLIAGVERAFFFEAFRSSSPSMAPTLFAGEYFFVHKSAYGFGAHRTPERGDVIVFPSPEHPEQDYVKRVIGLPGDTIRIQQGVVFINDWRLPSCVAGLATLPVEDKKHVGVVMVELLGDIAYLIFHEDTGHHHDETEHHDGESSGGSHTQGPYTVPLNEVFVLGDSRENSHDSRDWFEGRGGGVPIASIKGRARAIWMSGDPNRVAWSRIGTSLAGGPRCPELFPPETCQAVEKCLSNRPSRDVTTPPIGR